MHDAPVRDLMKIEGKVDRHRHVFRGAGYQKVTSRINEDDMRVQAEGTRRRKNGFGIIIAETRGACVIAIIWLGQKVGREQDGLKS